ncbi:MAG: hypothetical protein ACK5P6_02070, partial [Pseudobdellovibrionaceae bacterium]
MRQTFAVMALLCLLLSTGCAEFKDSDEASPEEALVSVNAFNDQIKVKIEPTAKAERYMVYWSWPKLGQSYRMRIRQQQTLAVLNSDQLNFSHEVDHDQSLSYIFEVLTPNGSVERFFSKLIVIPKDFVVREGQNVITENKKIFVNRFFISQKPLITQGHEVSIITNELISDRGFIETFPKDSTASIGENGKAAGNLNIQANLATGTLHIITRGQPGGDGSPAKEHLTRAQDGKAP